MISDMGAIRKGIAANLAAVFTDWQVSAYLLSSPSAPCMYVIPDLVDYDMAMGQGLTKATYLVRALVSPSLEPTGQTQLDEITPPTGSRSLKAALESDKTLGGAVQFARVVSASQPKLVTGGSTELMGIDFTVEVMG